MIIISTVNIGLKFDASRGIPTLEKIETMLKSIRTNSKEPINLKVTSEITQVGTSIKTASKNMAEFRSSIPTRAENNRLENLTRILKEMSGVSQGLKELGTGLNKIAKMDMSSFQANIKVIRQELSKISQINLSGLQGLNNLGSLNRNTTRATTRRNTEENNYPNAPYQNIMYGMAGIGIFKNYMQFSLGLEKAIYDLGVVSGESNVKLSQMYTTFLAMSQEMPISAQRLTENITEIARVGFDLEKSIAIGTAGAKFAIASGDKIEGVTDSLAKVLLALDLTKVSVEEVTRITDEMQSVLLKTPLSTQTLSEGMRHASSAMAVFTQNSQRTGDDLENYKKEVLTTTLALEGSFSRIGRSGSQSGLHVRELYTKIIAMDKAAKAMFDENTLGLYFNEASKTINKTGEGAKLTSEYFMSLAEKDMPKALELLSKLYSSGTITTQTLKKMMTERGMRVLAFFKPHSNREMLNKVC